MEELAQLAKSAGAIVIGNLIQKLPVPNKTHYLGKGKLDELLVLKSSAQYNIVIFDDELSPIQQANLEDILKVKVIDRSALILDIFSRRANTREGKLQVELAQHQYLLPRLAGQWSHLERLGGGIGTRGPGESQLETDRRLIRNRIKRLKDQIEKVKQQRELHRYNRRRTGIKVIALVGYTNAGKSTLLNVLSKAEVLAKNELFSTLDPTTRRLMLPDNHMVLMTDTVGFIHKLPPMIIAAFRATLEELSDADLLIHVIDLTSHNAAEQCLTVERILVELGLAQKTRITVLNKIDLLLDNRRQWTEKAALDFISELGLADQCSITENTVLISAVKKWGVSKLLEISARTLSQLQ